MATKGGAVSIEAPAGQRPNCIVKHPEGFSNLLEAAGSYGQASITGEPKARSCIAANAVHGLSFTEAGA